MQRGARHKEGGEAEGGVFHGLLGGPNLETTIWRKVILGKEFTSTEKVIFPYSGF